MGKLSNTMWRLLGAQASRNQSKSITVINRADGFEDWAAEVDDADIASTASGLDLAHHKGDGMPKFLALVREAADRTLDLRPFDVQLQGALRLLEGDIVEMATGEGKTLSGAIAAVGYALGGHQVHVISVNDYLATRDERWMAPLFDAFGLSHAAVSEASTREERKRAYTRDIVYASVNEIGFDVLRDQLAVREDELVAPTPDVAIIDEADSVLVDEALVPLILAGAARGDAPRAHIDQAVRRLRKGVHFEIDDEQRNVFLTDEGAAHVEELLGGLDLYDAEHVGTTLVEVNIALHAHNLVERDVHYIVRDGEVRLINSSRGRVAELQRWPDGLQAAVELKEGLAQTESGEVIDTITVQALVGRYPHVCGMTGTALAAGEQFRQFYSLAVSQIPPNTPNVRVDEPDRVYDTKAAKAEAIVEFIAEQHETGRPILIGTHDVAESEELEFLLRKAGVTARVLNAKNDAEEATIIAEAGKKDAVTVSTQMAGRGTDIKLGGSGREGARGIDPTDGEDEGLREEVVELGGLCVVGTGRHETERLDFQLRGRAGRQGDPGMSVFFASLEDPVVTRNLSFKKPPVSGEEDGSMGAKGRDTVEQAQRIAEGIMLEVHANTWRYSELVNQQRDIVIARRRELLGSDAALTELAELEPERHAELTGDGKAAKAADEEEAASAKAVSAKAAEPIPADVLEQAAREIMLFHLDRAWADHLAFSSDVRASIHLRSIGRQSPLDEYHKLLVEEFAALPQRALDAARETFRTAAITADGVDLEASDLRRSTTTWTYMVHDNPFTSKGGAKAFAGIVGIFR